MANGSPWAKLPYDIQYQILELAIDDHMYADSGRNPIDTLVNLMLVPLMRVTTVHVAKAFATFYNHQVARATRGRKR